MNEVIQSAIGFIAHGIVWVLAVAILCFAIGYIIDCAQRLYERIIRAERYTAARDVGIRIKAGSYWFDKDARIVLEEVGNFIHEHGYFDPQDIRDAVRKRQKDNAS